MMKAIEFFNVSPKCSARALLVSGLMLALLAATGCATKAPDRAVGALCAPDASLKEHSQRTLLGVGYEALQKNNLVCAERLLAEAHNLDQKDPWALLNLGVVRQRMGQSDSARIAYHMAAAIDPKTSGLQMSPNAVSEQKAEDALMATQDTFVKKSPGQVALENLKLIR